MTLPKRNLFLTFGPLLVSALCLAQPANTSGTYGTLVEILKDGPSKTYLVAVLTDSLLALPTNIRMERTRDLIDEIDVASSSLNNNSKGIALYLKAWLEGPLLNARKRAMATLLKGLTLAEKLDDPYLQFLFRAQILQTNSNIGEYQPVTEGFRDLQGRFARLDRNGFPGHDRPDSKTMERNRTFSDQQYLDALNTTGRVYLELGSPDAAMTLFKAAKSYAEKTGDAVWTTVAESNVGLVQEAKGNYKEALVAVEADYRRAVARRDWPVACEIATKTAHLEVLLGERSGAKMMLDTAKLLMSLDPEQKELLETNYTRVLAELAAAANDYFPAYKLYSQYVNAARVATTKLDEKTIQDIEKTYTLAHTRENIHALESENSVKTNSLRLHSLVSKGTVAATILAAILAILLTIILQRQRRANRFISAQRDEIKNKNEELESALENLKAAQEQLVHSEKISSLGQMTAGLVHEINNPVNFVQSGSESLQENLTLLSKVLSEYAKINASNVRAKLADMARLRDEMLFDDIRPEMQELVKVVRTGSERTATIISRLNRFSKNDREDFIEILIVTPLEETLALLAGEFRNKIVVETLFEPGLSVLGSSGELAQVFMNILMNASHAMKGQGSIRIKTSRVDQNVLISLIDTGPGIPPEILGKIFDPFFTTKRVGEGMGLGLSISHGIVERHNGQISARNIPGGGVEFIVCLPAAK